MLNENNRGAERSILGLELHHKLLDKILLTISLLIVGPLLGLVLMLGAANPDLEAPWSWIVARFINTLEVFYLLLLVFIWWRPSWLRRHYYNAERKVVYAIYIFFLGSMLMFALSGIVGLVRALI